MNLSGNSVVQFLNYFNIPISNLIVIFDDVDIQMGKMRIKEKGSAGTHNGMKSIINSIVNMYIIGDTSLPFLLNKFTIAINLPPLERRFVFYLYVQLKWI